MAGLCAATLIAVMLPTTAGAAVGAAASNRGRRACVSSPKPARGPGRQIFDVVEKAKKELHLRSVLFSGIWRGTPGLQDSVGKCVKRLVDLLRLA
jgi:hypothetical protein